MNLFDPETWKQEWAVFASAPWIILPFMAIAAVAAWFFRGTRSSGEISGLKAQIEALRERLTLATEQTSAADRAKDEAVEDSRNLKDAIAAKADKASLEALSVKLDTAIGQWAAANNAVRSTLGILQATEVPDIASFTIDTRMR